MNEFFLQNLFRLELFYNRTTTINKIRAHLPIRYVIHFPVHYSLPLIMKIAFNQRVLCEPMAGHFGLTTEIALHHRLYTGLGTNNFKAVMVDTMKSLDHTDIGNNGGKLQRMISKHNINSSKNSFECGRADKRFQKSPLNAGGRNIQHGSWPWIAAMFTVEEIRTVYTCAGSLVSDRVIVTAAHCFRPGSKVLNPGEVLMALGLHYIDNMSMGDGTELVDVAEIVLHPDYRKMSDKSSDADIAVARLRRAVEFNEYIRPICLWPDVEATDLTDVVGKMATIVGWGGDGEGQKVTQTPGSINVPIVSDGDCLRSNVAFGVITSNRTLCAGRRDGSGPCHGDSGSGLAMLRDGRMVLRGIVSTALADPINSCDLSNYVVFTDASKFVEWIRTFN